MRREPKRRLSLNQRTLRPTGSPSGGEVDDQTVFAFHQEGNMVWASYAGGRIRLGFLVGTLSDDVLTFRYAQLNSDDETATGRSVDRVEQLPDGRVRLHEQWTWESKLGEGTGILEEDQPYGETPPD